MPRFPTAVAAAIAALVTASCSAMSPTKSAPSSTTVAATTISPQATTIPVVTTIAPTTVAPTVPPTVAPTTTTTLSPTELAEAEVRAAYQSFALQTEACYRTPSACVPEEFDVEPELSAYRKHIADDFVTPGRHAESNPADAAYSVVDGPITFTDGGQTASFNTCLWDTDILYQDNPRVVANDLSQTIRETFVFRKVDGKWFVAGSGPNGPWVVGRNECGPRP
jgi:hypothetical protein